MSVAASSPLCGKRHLDLAEEHTDAYNSTFSSTKRVRVARSPCGRPLAAPERPAYHSSHPAAAFAALQGLFPDMDEHVRVVVAAAETYTQAQYVPQQMSQTISKVLSEHGSDIDAAVRKLNELRLGMEAAANDAAIKASSNGVTTPPEQHQATNGTWCVWLFTSRLLVPLLVPIHHTSIPGDAAPPTMSSLESWVDSLLQELSSVTDMDAARARATRVLEAFARALGQPANPETQRLQAQLAEAGKENTILKRAVAIQANRLQELGAKDAEV